MLLEIIVIIVLAALLYILLRHWPQTERVVRYQQINVRKPKEEQELPRRLTAKAVASVRQGWGFIVRVFSGEAKDRPRQATTRFKDLDLINQNNSIDDHDEDVDVEPAAGKADQTKSADQSQQKEFELLVGKAEVAQRKGEYDQAEKYLIKAASLQPSNPKVYSRLGIVYLEKGEDWHEAEQAFIQALKFDRNNGYAHNNLGLVLYHQDKYAAAAREFEKSIQINNQVASRHVNLGLAYMSLRQFGKAESAFKKALKLDSNNQEYQELASEAADKKRSHRAI